MYHTLDKHLAEAEFCGRRRMTVNISRWGNSLGIRLPKSVLEDSHLREGDRVDIVCEDGRIVLSKVHQLTLDELLEGMTPENGHPETFPTLEGNEAW